MNLWYFLIIFFETKVMEFLIINSICYFETQAHPFITKYDNPDVDLASYFTSAGPSLATL